MKSYRFPVLLWMVLSSCGIYRQNVVNVPAMQQKGQAQAGGHISFNGYDGQASYAVTKKIGFMANYNEMGPRREIYSPKSSMESGHYFGEAGVGIYGKTKKGNNKELFFLAGRGMTSRTKTSTDSAGTVSTLVQRVRYSRFLIQSDWGLTQKDLETIISPRLFFIHYYDIKDDFRYDYRNFSHSYIYAEGAVTLRYRLFKFMIISGQACFTLPLTAGGGYNHYYEFAPFNYSIGLIFSGNLFKTGAETKN